jgi:hypothetical protein
MNDVIIQPKTWWKLIYTTRLFLMMRYRRGTTRLFFGGVLRVAKQTR